MDKVFIFLISLFIISLVMSFLYRFLPSKKLKAMNTWYKAIESGRSSSYEVKDYNWFKTFRNSRYYFYCMTFLSGLGLICRYKNLVEDKWILKISMVALLSSLYFLHPVKEE